MGRTAPAIPTEASSRCNKHLWEAGAPGQGPFPGPAPAAFQALPLVSDPQHPPLAEARPGASSAGLGTTSSVSKWLASPVPRTAARTPMGHLTLQAGSTGPSCPVAALTSQAVTGKLPASPYLGLNCGPHSAPPSTPSEHSKLNRQGWNPQAGTSADVPSTGHRGTGTGSLVKSWATWSPGQLYGPGWVASPGKASCVGRWTGKGDKSRARGFISTLCCPPFWDLGSLHRGTQARG